MIRNLVKFIRRHDDTLIHVITFYVTIVLVATYSVFLIVVSQSSNA